MSDLRPGSPPRPYRPLESSPVPASPGRARLERWRLERTPPAGPPPRSPPLSPEVAALMAAAEARRGELDAARERVAELSQRTRAAEAELEGQLARDAGAMSTPRSQAKGAGSLWRQRAAVAAVERELSLEDRAAEAEAALLTIETLLRARTQEVTGLARRLLGEPAGAAASAPVRAASSRVAGGRAGGRAAGAGRAARAPAAAVREPG